MRISYNNYWGGIFRGPVCEMLGDLKFVKNCFLGATLGRGGQNYRRLSSFLMSHAKNYSNRPMFHGAIEKNKWHVFMDRGVEGST